MIRTIRFGLPLLALLVCLCGCGTQGVLLGEEGEGYFFAAYDSLALPGEAVQLRARLQAGDLLAGKDGCVVRFEQNGKLFKAAETNGNGTAEVTYRPEKAGDQEFVAEVSPNGLSGKPPQPQKFIVACRTADTPMMVVDLDKTLVASGFQTVLVGEARAMPDSPQVMRRLAQRYAPVYLTHRPDYFGPKSKAWLRRNGYPTGPLLLSDLSGFLRGSRAFKSRMLADLQQRFRKIEIGIGDKISDARSYHDNGIRAYLILPIPENATPEQYANLAAEVKDLPPDVEVVTRWSQIEKSVFDGVKPSRAEVVKRIEAKAAAAPSDAKEAKP